MYTQFQHHGRDCFQRVAKSTAFQNPPLLGRLWNSVDPHPTSAFYQVLIDRITIPPYQPCPVRQDGLVIGHEDKQRHYEWHVGAVINTMLAEEYPPSSGFAIVPEKRVERFDKKPDFCVEKWDPTFRQRRVSHERYIPLRPWIYVEIKKEGGGTFENVTGQPVEAIRELHGDNTLPVYVVIGIGKELAFFEYCPYGDDLVGTPVLHGGLVSLTQTLDFFCSINKGPEENHFVFPVMDCTNLDLGLIRMETPDGHEDVPSVFHLERHPHLIHYMFQYMGMARPRVEGKIRAL